MNELTQDQVRELFDYRDGNLYWRESKSSRAQKGDRAGTVIKYEYRQVRINGEAYYTHRLIFLYHHGYLPKFLDHIDGNKSNNDISNIREVTHPQNHQNRKKSKSINGKPTTSRFKGVYLDKQREKWHVRIVINRKHKHLGYFINEIDAAKCYNDAAIKHFGDYACLNIIDEDA